jgi:hypothetical protein
MRTALTVVLAVSLLAHLGAYVTLLVRLARARGARGVIVPLLFPPLAALWGYESGFKREAYVWLGGLAAYAIAVALA